MASAAPAPAAASGAKAMVEAAGSAALALLNAQPPDSSTLGNMRTLDLRGLELKQVPSNLSCCSSLVRLDLGNNPLASFPEEVSSLKELEIMFASNMDAKEVPTVLAKCPRLRIVGLKDNRLVTIDGSRLPPELVWLIAAGNLVQELPNISHLQRVRKLMLSHNRLTCEALAAVAGIADLEMLRVAANRLESFPEALLRHSRLSWVAAGSNPFSDAALKDRLAAAPAVVDFAEVSVGERLGSGAGATVYRGKWKGRDVAVKIWEAEEFSDGTSRGEWAANRVASSPGHSSLVEVLGVFEQPRPGMILELLSGAIAAASPPSFVTVTRDALPTGDGKGPWFTAAAALQIAESVASATAYLHAKGVLHGDIYLHNTLVITGAEGASRSGAPSRADVEDARLSDFGAAAVVPDDDVGRGLQRIEVRSFGWLLQDFVEMLDAPPGLPPAEGETLRLLRTVRERCGQTDVDKLPTFTEVAALLSHGLGKRPRVGGEGLSAL